MKIFKKRKAAESEEERTGKYERIISEVEEISPSQYKHIVQQSTEHHHHHHHSHHSHHHSGSGAEKSKHNSVTDLSSGNIRKFTEEYTDSRTIDRATPKHPHPHDKIAHDSKYSAEELDELNAVKISSFSDTGIDEFKQSFDEYISQPSRHHRHHSRSAESEKKTDEVSENFDVDKFLSEVGKSSHSHRR